MVNMRMLRNIAHYAGYINPQYNCYHMGLYHKIREFEGTKSLSDFTQKISCKYYLLRKVRKSKRKHNR